MNLARHFVIGLKDLSAHVIERPISYAAAVLIIRIEGVEGSGALWKDWTLEQSPTPPQQRRRFVDRLRRVKVDTAAVAAVAAVRSEIPNLRDRRYDPLFKDGEPTPAELSTLLDIAKFQVDFQVKMAERLDNKARGLLAITTAFAGAVLAYALRDDVLDQLSPGSRAGVLIAAAVIVLSTGVAIINTVKAIVLTREREVVPELLIERVIPALQGDKRIPAELAYWHLDLAHSRKLANDTRADRAKVAEYACFVTISIAVVEFAVAVLTQL
jgi:hypothetical protein